MIEVLSATITSVYGLAFPRLTSSNAAEANTASTALRGGVLAASFSGEVPNTSRRCSSLSLLPASVAVAHHHCACGAQMNSETGLQPSTASKSSKK